MIFDFVFWGFGFLRMGTTGLAAQADGAGDAAERNAVLSRALLLARRARRCSSCCLQAPIGWLAFALLERQRRRSRPRPASITTIRIWSAPATLANYALLGWLLGAPAHRPRAAGRARAQSRQHRARSLFVLGFGWGVAGVAAASVIAELRRRSGSRSSSAIGSATGSTGAASARGILDRARLMRRCCGSICDILVRTLSLIAAFALFTATGARMGDLPLAGNAILMNFFLPAGLRARRLRPHRADPGRAPRSARATGRPIAARSATPRSGRPASRSLGAAGFALAGPSLIALYSVNPRGAGRGARLPALDGRDRRWSRSGASSSTASSSARPAPPRCATACSSRSPPTCWPLWLLVPRLGQSWAVAVADRVLRGAQPYPRPLAAAHRRAASPPQPDLDDPPMPSFDIVSKTELAEVDNALNGMAREIATRFDFKGSKCTVERKENADHPPRRRRHEAQADAGAAEGLFRAAQARCRLPRLQGAGEGDRQCAPPAGDRQAGHRRRRSPSASSRR